MTAFQLGGTYNKYAMMLRVAATQGADVPLRNFPLAAIDGYRTA